MQISQVLADSSEQRHDRGGQNLRQRELAYRIWRGETVRCSAQAQCSNCSLEKWADTAVWLCTRTPQRHHGDVQLLCHAHFTHTFTFDIAGWDTSMPIIYYLCLRKTPSGNTAFYCSAKLKCNVCPLYKVCLAEEYSALLNKAKCSCQKVAA